MGARSPMPATRTAGGSFISTISPTQTHTQLTDADAEDSVPAWVQGIRTYAWSHDGKAIYFIRNQASRNSLWRIDVRDHKLRRITALDHLHVAGANRRVAAAGEVALIASASTIPDRIITYEVDHATYWRLCPRPSDQPSIQAIVDDDRAAEWIRKRSRSEMLMAQYAPTEPISWTGHDGGTVYGLYTAPLSPKYECAGAPPLIVKVHGGPTSQARPSSRPKRSSTRRAATPSLRSIIAAAPATVAPTATCSTARGALTTCEDSASGAQHLVDQGLADRQAAGDPRRQRGRLYRAAIAGR